MLFSRIKEVASSTLDIRGRIQRGENRLKNRLRIRLRLNFDSMTCLSYLFLDFFQYRKSQADSQVDSQAVFQAVFSPSGSDPWISTSSFLTFFVGNSEFSVPHLHHKTLVVRRCRRRNNIEGHRVHVEVDKLVEKSLHALDQTFSLPGQKGARVGRCLVILDLAVLDLLDVDGRPWPIRLS